LNENYDEPKKSGTALKVILIIITVIAVIAAAALGLLYYNSLSTIDAYRDKITALTETCSKWETDYNALNGQIQEYDDQIASLTEQLEDAQEQLENMVPAVNGEEGGEEGNTNSNTPVIDLSGNTDLSVKPDKLYDAGVAYTVKVAGLNMRSGPNTTYKIITSVSLDSTVTAYAEDGEWLLVSADGSTFGWVKSSFVEKK